MYENLNFILGSKDWSGKRYVKFNFNVSAESRIESFTDCSWQVYNICKVKVYFVSEQNSGNHNRICF